MKNYLKGIIINNTKNKSKNLLIYFYKFNNKYNLLLKKFIIYLIQDDRNECMNKDIILVKKFNLIKFSKTKIFKLLKIIF